MEQLRLLVLSGARVVLDNETVSSTEQNGEPPVIRSSAELGDLCVDPSSHSVTWANQVARVSEQEFQLLWILASNAGRACAFEELYFAGWGREYRGDAEMVVCAIK